MTLEELKTDRICQIISIDAPGAMKQRLLSLGLRPGKEVQMIKSAPLKDPLEISLGNKHISIRRSEAALIIVELLMNHTHENEQKNHHCSCGQSQCRKNLCL
jgi:Fe2+ transport system protein FeoA